MGLFLLARSNLQQIYNFVKFYNITALFSYKSGGHLEKIQPQSWFFLKLKDDFKVLRYNWWLFK